MRGIDPPNFHAGREILKAQADLIAEQATTIARLRAALRPFADRVFNDNGDITISDTYRLSRHDFVDAYYAYRAALAQTTKPEES